ncbi:hypothetical protein [Desulfogranum marinum]|jgi:hypothetical protein|uniref:hypothetical protein n=1 Tax=Desulfogranum marinum TaxID=453220 RepID=UPI0029C77C1D|nr:hypothetical protein [Desulfogranum marinum]
MKGTTGFLLVGAFTLMAVFTSVAAVEQEQAKAEQGQNKEKGKPPAPPQKDGYTVFVPTQRVDADTVIDLPADI